MIISHRHRFIFLRTEKTAGSSIEFALAEFCGPEDIVTGIPADLAARIGLDPHKGKAAWTRRFPIRTGGLRRAFPALFGVHTHASAAQVKAFLPDSVFASYFKFAVERNPWDRQVSLYYQRALKHRSSEPNFSRDMGSFLYRSLHYTRMRNWETYAINNQIAVDEVIRYERLAEGLAAVARKIGLPKNLPIGDQRSGFRPAGFSYRDHYTPRTRQLVQDWYSREIAAFGYQF